MFSEGAIPKKQKVAGVRATERAVSMGRAQTVLIAKDAESKVLENLLKLCSDQDVRVEHVDSMKELGELSGLRVGAAACAILKE